MAVPGMWILSLDVKMLERKVIKIAHHRNPGQRTVV
jgi:hypothetical protein